jgi:hypothetical protein
MVFLYLIRNYEKIKDNTLASKFSVLYENLKTDKIQYLLYNIVLLIRRIVYGINVILFHSSPFIQVVINSSFSFTIYHYILIFKPYKTRLDNIMNFYIEFITFCIFSIIGAFIKEDLSGDSYNIAEWSLIILIYSSIVLPAVVNIVISIKDLIIYFKERSKPQPD